MTENQIAEEGGFDKEKDRKLRRFHRSIVIGCIMVGCGRALGVLRNPDFPAVLTSLYENPRQLPFPVKLLFFGVHLHINTFHYLNFAFNLMKLIYYYYGFVSMVTSLQLQGQTRGVCRGGWATDLEDIARSQGELFILQSVCNGIFGTYVFVIEIIGILFSTFNLFEAVAYSNFKGFPLGLISILVAFIVFGTMADIHDESERARQSWRSVRVKWFVKFCKPARPLAVTVNSFYFVDRQLLLTMLDIITSNTANLILTYRF